MVNHVQTWLSDQGYLGRIAVRGAWDMEPAWSSFTRANNWMHGYDGSNSYTLLANYSADGCPSTRIYKLHVEWELCERLDPVQRVASC
ncbi:MAG TPA: hypothetical protein VE569_04545 [Acidimicrobiia bacterium]|jgi:hypothetical protein|nr:hypothetical protein [Acidimicrobiia bacterium]